MARQIAIRSGAAARCSAPQLTGAGTPLLDQLHLARAHANGWAHRNGGRGGPGGAALAVEAQRAPADALISHCANASAALSQTLPLCRLHAALGVPHGRQQREGQGAR